MDVLDYKKINMKKLKIEIKSSYLFFFDMKFHKIKMKKKLD